MPNDKTPTSTVLTDYDRARLYRAMHRMPYAAGITPPSWTATATNMDDLISTLEKLADRLHEHAEECRARETELFDIQSEIRSAGRLLSRIVSAGSPSMSVALNHPGNDSDVVAGDGILAPESANAWNQAAEAMGYRGKARGGPAGQSESQE